MFIGCYHNSDSCLRCPCANQFLVNYAYHLFSINYVTQQAATNDGLRDNFFNCFRNIREVGKRSDGNKGSSTEKQRYHSRAGPGACSDLELWNAEI